MISKQTYINSDCHRDSFRKIFLKIYELQKKKTFRVNKKSGTFIDYAINKKSKSTAKDGALGRYFQKLPSEVNKILIACS